MYGTLYRIFNINSGKSYIGKTYYDIHDRLRGHLKDRHRFKDRPLYRAFNKYGIDNFSLEILGYFESGNLELEEIEAISKFDSYHNGYNATKGGEGSKTLRVSDNIVVDTYLEVKSLKAASRLLNISTDSVKRVLNLVGIETYSAAEVYTHNYNYSNEILETSTGIIFSSAREWYEFLIDSEVVQSTSTYKSVSNSIHRVCKGEREYYLGLKFEYT